MRISPRTAPTIERSLEPGYVFDPTDEELMVDYLHGWITNQSVPCDIVILDDVYSTEPWNLLLEYGRGVEGYFLTQVTADRNIGARKKRTAGEGSYTIQSRGDGGDHTKITWRKSTFTYHCKAAGERKRTRKASGWVMHEYEITSMESEWVLCRVKLSNQEISRRRKRYKGSSDLVVVADQEISASFFEYEQQGRELVVYHEADGDPPILEIEQQEMSIIVAECNQDPLMMIDFNDIIFLETEGVWDWPIAAGIEAEQQKQQERDQLEVAAARVDGDGLVEEQGQEDLAVTRDEEEKPMDIFEELGDLDIKIPKICDMFYD